MALREWISGQVLRLGRRVHAAREPDVATPEGPSEWLLVPWLLLASGPAADVWKGEVAPRWLAGAGLTLFAGCYLAIVFAGSSPVRAKRRIAQWLLLPAMALASGLGAAYGGGWLILFSLLSLATGAAVRMPAVQPALLAVVSGGVLTAACSGHTEEVATVAYSSLLSGAVVAIIRRLVALVHELHGTRSELARSAVEQERLRFSRDLHDLLGHTMSVVVVKAEAVRRLAPHDPDAALAQAADIEAIGRQALTEIREAVTGYREGGLATELTRARSLLDAAGIQVAVRQSGPPLPPQTAALLGWVVREGVTNTVRHSGAARCEITLCAGPDSVRLDVVDDGTGSTATAAHDRTGASGLADHPTTPGGGTGLSGLAERLAAAGGVLRFGPDGRRGFRLTAELPLDVVMEGGGIPNWGATGAVAPEPARQ